MRDFMCKLGNAKQLSSWFPHPKNGHNKNNSNAWPAYLTTLTTPYWAGNGEQCKLPGQGKDGHEALLSQAVVWKLSK